MPDACARRLPLSLVIMHVVYGLTAYPVGRMSDRIGTSGLLLWSLCFLIAAHLTLGLATTVWVYVLGTVLWGLHVGFSQGSLGAMIAGVTPHHLRGSAFGTFNLVTGVVVLAGKTLPDGSGTAQAQERRSSWGQDCPWSQCSSSPGERTAPKQADRP